MTARVKPCPFCGCDKPMFYESEDPKLTLSFVWCPKCRTEGPTSHFSMEQAIERWNGRSEE